VLKFLMERNSVNALHGHVTSGTLILQDCAVSLLFALLPVLGGTSGVLQGVTYMTKSNTSCKDLQERQFCLSLIKLIFFLNLILF
ncbi:hypothetical protein S245_036068, partial [Arachis hypogaea]